MYNYLLYSCLTLNFTGNNTEDKIMEHSLGVLKNEGFTTSPPRLKIYIDESQGGHLFSGMAALLKRFCLLLKFQVLG